MTSPHMGQHDNGPARELGSPPPLVSLVVPCRNEELYLQSLLDSIERQSYPASRVEIVFVDGMSGDGTIKILSAFAERRTNVKIIPNPARFVPQAMNLGIRAATGAYVVRLDAHATYVDTYLETLITAAHSLGCDNVGCVFKTATRASTPKASGIARALAHPIGVGNSLFRIGVQEPTEVDTVPFGCYRRLVFDRIGYYDERLVRNQDIELNRRLKRMGGHIFLLPALGGTYFCREDYQQLWQNNWDNGKWVVLTAAMTANLSSLSVRHFVPLAFVSYLAILPILAPISLAAILPLVVYVALIATATLRQFRNSGGPRVAIHFAAAIVVLHISYGLGSLAAVPHLLKLPRPRHE